MDLLLFSKLLLSLSINNDDNNNRKREKYLDLAREIRKLLIMKMSAIPTVIDTLGTVPKGMEWELNELKG